MLVYFAIFLVVLMGFIGLAVDVGHLELRTLQLQVAADSGALGGAAEWAHFNTNWYGAAFSDANSDENLNSYPTSYDIVVRMAASSGPYSTDYAAIQTTITQSVPTPFLSLLNHGSTTVKVTAVADAPPCSYFFSNPASSHAAGGIDLASAKFSLGCPIYVKGTPVVDEFSHAYYHQIKSSAALSGKVVGGGDSTYLPFYNVPVLSDPLAYVTEPSPSTCKPSPNPINSSITLTAGTYCGGLTINGATVTLMPGTYVLTGGMRLTNATLNGAGVTIYLTKGGSYGYSQLVSHSSVWNISAPTDASAGGLPGIALMGDRNWVGGNEDFIFNSGSWSGDGIIYTTGTGITDSGCNMAGVNYFGFDTANMYVYAATIFPSANYATVAGGSPFHNAAKLVQ